jgi:hypothetical protein
LLAICKSFKKQIQTVGVLRSCRMALVDSL